ncbi:MAG: DUF4145 domain-containing protein [Candidatus Coatesbacteria bacterium]|nr:DUF4145 domain-containing protein [Candidatus Coatesbacteria bacterium]
MKCRHCGTKIHWQPERHDLRKEMEEEYICWEWIEYGECPECHEMILEFGREAGDYPVPGQDMPAYKQLYWPRPAWPIECFKDVPPEVMADYNEACAVIDISPTAAAALARRCMQYILVKEGGAPDYKGVSIKEQVNAVIDDPRTPEHIKRDLDAVRQIGNFSAHASKDVTGNVMRAKPEEAEWALETLARLLECYYTDPAQSEKRHAALEARLAKIPEKPKRPKKAKR